MGGVPVIEHLLERLEAAGCDEIRVVTRSAKLDLIDYARERGTQVIVGSPPHVGASIELALAGLAPDDLVALGFPDTIWQPTDGFVRLRRRLETGDEDVVLGLFQTPDAGRSDVVILGAGDRVEHILIKPGDAPSDLIWGCLVARCSALAGVGAVDEPSRLLVRRRPAPVGVVLSSAWIDVGTAEGLAAARRAFG